MTATITTIVETVDLAQLVNLDRRLADLAKVAKKLDLPAPTYRIVDRKTEETNSGVVELVTVEVVDVDLSLGDYRVLCSIDHTANVVTALAGAPEGIVAEYVDSQPSCDFCGKNLRRNKTFVVEDSNGDRKRVGGSCVKNYLGRHGNLSDALLAQFADLSSSLFDEDSEGGYGGRTMFTVSEIVTQAVAVIRTYGYAKGGGTRDCVLMVLGGHLPSEMSRTEKESLRVTADDIATAEAAIEFVKNSEDTSNFGLTMRQVANIELDATKHAGVACYFSEAYRRHIESTMTQQLTQDVERQACPVGRTTVTGTVVSVKFVEDRYSYDYNEVKKLVVLDDRGFKVHLTEPRSVCVEVGDRLQFSVDIQPSDDPHFGFGKRPTKATTEIK